MTEVIYHKSISTLLANDVTSSLYKKRRCGFRSPLMKTLGSSVETLGRECNSNGLCIHFYKTRVARETWVMIIQLQCEQKLIITLFRFKYSSHYSSRTTCMDQRICWLLWFQPPCQVGAGNDWHNSATEPSPLPSSTNLDRSIPSSIQHDMERIANLDVSVWASVFRVYKFRTKQSLVVNLKWQFHLCMLVMQV